VQEWGRGVRNPNGDKTLLILDMAGNAQRLGYVEDIHHDTLDSRAPGDRKKAFEGEKKPKKPYKCPHCNAIIPRNRTKCPVCAATLKVISQVEHRKGELIEFGEAKPKKSKSREYTMEQKQQFYSGLLWIAKERGKSEGIAAHRYRDKFGVWPNQLKKEPAKPTLEVERFDKYCRIKWAKSKQKEDMNATSLHEVNG
jgi:hypothetical protein